MELTLRPHTTCVCVIMYACLCDHVCMYVMIILNFYFPPHQLVRGFHPQRRSGQYAVVTGGWSQVPSLPSLPRYVPSFFIARKFGSAFHCFFCRFALNFANLRSSRITFGLSVSQRQRKALARFDFTTTSIP